MATQRFLEQLKNHSVAIISLIIAITTLFYTTWREEQTEKNRNIRQAAFEVLKHLGELQIVVNYAHYESDNSMGNPVLGWGHIAIIGDLSELLPPPVPSSSEKLVSTWTNTWETLKTSNENTQLISNEIDKTRNDTLSILRNLR
jgi:hypothetical protein